MNFNKADMYYGDSGHHLSVIMNFKRKLIGLVVLTVVMMKIICNW
jgi:CBS-domain-containing membrane protein